MKIFELILSIEDYRKTFYYSFSHKTFNSYEEIISYITYILEIKKLYKDIVAKNIFEYVDLNPDLLKSYPYHGCVLENLDHLIYIDKNQVKHLYNNVIDDNQLEYKSCYNIIFKNIGITKVNI